MATVDENIEALKKTVQAASDEASIAVRFHETWRPTAYDSELHARMGHSYATQSFQVVRWSLRRETILALMRLWDSNPKGIRMTKIAELLRKKEVFSALVEARATGMYSSPAGILQAFRASMEPTRDRVLQLELKYSKDGEGHEVIEQFRKLRHERLAHRQIEPAETPRTEATDKELEIFYADSLEIVRHLLSLVLGTAFDHREEAGVYRHHAKFFWANARGERTPGHPSYRAPI